jgi:hypothetical protein
MSYILETKTNTSSRLLCWKAAAGAPLCVKRFIEALQIAATFGDDCDNTELHNICAYIATIPNEDLVAILQNLDN